MTLKGGKQKYVQYYCSMDVAFCQGPVDSMQNVFFKEKPVYEVDGSEAMLFPGSRDIDKQDLFGDDEREGGIVGRLHYCDGSFTQLMPAEMAERLNFTPATGYAYRGICHLVLHGNDDSDRAGAKVATNSPNVPTMWGRFRRGSYALNTNDPIIVGFDGYYNSNPAHIIYECLTNTVWGMGGNPDLINEDSFVYCASIMQSESLGLSMLWDTQSQIQEFISDVLDVINALYFFDPFIGQTRIKLLRDDYDRDSLLEFGPDDVVLKTFRRKLWGETINEVTVQFTDGTTEEQDSVTFQDDGNISMQDGAVVSETRSMHQIRHAEVAVSIAKRELTYGAAPLASVEFSVNRRRWKHLPGDVIKFRWPAYNIEQTILRVMEVDWGTVDNSEIHVKLVEDIFSFQLAEFALPQTPEWEDPKQDPESGDYSDLKPKFFAAPYSLIQQDFPNATEEDLSDDQYPRIMVGVIVSPPSAKLDENGDPLPDQHDLQSFNLYVDAIGTTGDPEMAYVGEKTLTGSATFKNPDPGIAGIPQAIETRIKIEGKHGGDGPEIGRYAIISDRTEYFAEWVMFTEKHGDGEWTVARGIFDTVPREWNNGTSIYFIGQSWDGYDMANALAFNTELYKLQPRTSAGLRDLENCSIVPDSRPDRPYLPYRPANVKIELTMFGGEDQTQGRWTETEDDDTWEPRQWILNVTWSRRNRKMEDAVVRRWDDGDMEPEPGQTTAVLLFGQRRVAYGGGGNVTDGGAGSGSGDPVDYGEFTRISGLTGTSVAFDIYEYTQQYEDLSIQVISERDGLTSLQSVVIDLGLYIKGYGSDWGYAFGGWPSGDAMTSGSGEGTIPAMTAGD
jgi:hypothetical protein